MVNMPTQLVPNLVDALMQDLAWAVENEETEAGPARPAGPLRSCSSGSPASHPAAAAAAAARRPDLGPPAALGREKLDEEAREVGRRQRASSLSGLQFGRLEEEILAQSAEAGQRLGSERQGRRPPAAHGAQALRQVPRRPARRCIP